MKNLKPLPADIKSQIKYQYEDDEVMNILSLKLSELKKPDIYTPALTVGNAATSLKSYLVEEKKQHQGKRTLLIPYNKSGAHWFGLVIKINAANQFEQIIYIDSLDEDKPYFGHLCNEVKSVYGQFTSTQRQIQFRLKQKDVTSCGPLTIENLIQVAKNTPEVKKTVTEQGNKAIRKDHISRYHPHDPSFYQRQLNNTNRVASSLLQNQWLRQAGSHFREKELLRIAHVVNLVNQLPEKDTILKVFQNEKKENHKPHLERIRKQFLNLIKKNPLNKILAELITTLFDVTHMELPQLVSLEHYRFQLDYQELREICEQVDSDDINDEVEEKIKNQVKKDEDFALKLQAQLWKTPEIKITDPFLWQIEVHRMTVVERIKQLTSKSLASGLAQLQQQIDLLNKSNKLKDKVLAVREELETILTEFLESVLSYLIANPHIGTKIPIENEYQYLPEYYFERFLSQFSEKSINYNKIRKHIDKELSSSGIKDPLWSLHNQNKLNELYGCIRGSSPKSITKRLTQSHKRILADYPQINKMIAKIAQREEKENPDKVSLLQEKNNLCTLIETLITKKRHQYGINLLDNRERIYNKMAMEEKDEDADEEDEENGLFEYQDREEKDEDEDENYNEEERDEEGANDLLGISGFGGRIRLNG